MLKIKKILFPTDFSKCSEQAFTHAIHFAKEFNAELHILNVNTFIENNPQYMNRLSGITDIKTMNEDITNNQINKLVDSANLENLKIVKIKKHGVSVSPTILKYANDNEIDLIVMGTHGRRGLGHLFLGSVAEEIVRLSKSPVLTIREEEKPTLISKIDNILVPIDFSERSNVSIKYAIEIAKVYNSKLQLLHVLEDTIPAAYSLSGIMSIYDIDPNIEEKIKNNIEKVFKETIKTEVEHQSSVTNGHAVKEILNFANNNNTDLIVIATHGLTGIEHLMIGSVAEKVSRMAHCPVFITKSFGKDLLAK